MKKAISLFLALVLMLTSVGPGLNMFVTASAASEIPTFTATGGSVIFEAEDAQLNESYSDLVTDANASGSSAVKLTNEPDNVAFVGKNYPNNLDWFGGKEGGNPVASVESSINFNFVTDMSGTYYVWVRLLCSQKSQTSVWGSMKNARYVYEPVTTNYVGDYQWVKLSNVKFDVTDSQVNQSVNLRFRARNLGMQWDKFLITNNAEYTPEGINPVLPVPTPTFKTVDGNAIFEAEDAKLYELNSDLVTEDTNSSSSTAVKMTNEEYDNTNFVKTTYPDDEDYQALFTSGGNPVKTVDPGIEFNFVPDVAGTYYVWVRLICSSKAQNTLYVSVNNANYGYEGQPADGFSEDYQWVRLNKTVAVADSGVDAPVNLRFRARKCGMLWDKFLITNDPDYIPESINPSLPELKIPTFNAVNGSVRIEAEDTALRNAYTNLVTGEETLLSGGKGVELTNTPAVAFDSAKSENDRSQFNEKGFPIASVPGGITFDFVPDVAGRYRIWVRQKAVRSDGACTIWCSIDNTTYTMATTHGPDNRDYYWVSLISFDVAEEDVGNPINFRFRGRFIGEVWDQIVITASLMYEPEGINPELPTSSGLGVIELPAYKDSNGNPVIPTITPTGSEHPRLLFTAADVPTIRANLTHPENAEAYALFLELKDQECSGILNADLENNYDAQALQIIEAKAFDYVINGNIQNGEEAIAAIKNYLMTYKSPDASTYYAEAGYGIYTAAEVYDWCYDLLDEDEKEEIVAKSQMVAMLFMSIGFPPSAQSSFVSHGSEQQLLRDWMSLAIATYDEYPSIYNYVVARYETEYVPARNYFYQSGGHYQGNYYGPFRFTWDLWAQTMLVNMSKTDDVEMIYTPKTQQVLYQWLYARRPDGELFREGDDGNERYPQASQWYKTTNYPFFLAANFYKDGILKNEFMANAEYPGGKGGVSAVQMLALNDTTVEAKNKSQLPLTKYISDPIGAMYARTGWNIGIGAPDVLAYMKIGQTWASNHVHRDAGSFQIYYKGILASESGEYQIYNDDHNELYNQSSIAHNTLGITSSANPTGVQRIPNKASGNTGTQYDTIDELIADAKDNTTGEVIGQEFGPDIYTPEYTYIAGDIAAAYDSNVQEAVRSMLFLPMDNGDYPAVFVVFDRITTAEVGSTKTFMLHMQSEPTIQDNVIVITNTATDYNGIYNGMLTNQTLLGYDKITAIGGTGHRFEVGGVNYEPDNFRYSEEGMEEGWGRVEISITTTEANQTDYFLNVMYVNDADKALTFEKAELIEAGNVYGVKIFDRVAIFNKAKARIEDTVTFEIPADADVTTFKVNVAGLKAGTWTITTSDGQTQTAVASEDGGIIYFSAPAGTCAMTRTGDDNNKSFTENQPAAKVGYDIKVNDSYVYSPVNATVENGELYLPVKTLLVAMGGELTESDGIATITYRGNVITLAYDKATIKPDGRPAMETTSFKVVDGEYLLAESFLKRTLGGYLEVEVNELVGVVEVTETNPDDIEDVEVIPDPNGNYAGSSMWDALDGDMDTYWGASGENGAELGIFDLGRVYVLNEIQIALHQGNVRTTSFDLYVSVDGISYAKVGETRTSSGTTLGFESYDMGGAQARYVKICGYGYNKNGTTGPWNSFKEIRFLGRVSPEILEEGTNLVYNCAGGETVIIHSSGEFYGLVDVKMDDVVIDASNYIVSEGSTIVEFIAAYLNTLYEGTHTVTLCYTNDRKVDVQLTIACTGVDADNDHKCDNGCAKFFGECVDSDLNHACDYGCTALHGVHADGEDKDHLCDYCQQSVGEECYGGVATCMTAAICEECGLAYGDKDPDHHTNYEAVVTAPTCGASGFTTYTCECGDSYEEAGEPATGKHAFGAWQTVKAAGCSVSGLRIRECVCGASQTERIPATGIHTYGAWTESKAPTCTAAGEKTRTCDCGAVETAAISALGHTEVIDKAVAATCTASGKTEGKHCATCNKVLAAQEEIPARGHMEVVDAGKPATHTADGLTDGKHCAICNDVLTAQEVIPAAGHSFGEWKVLKAATETEAGEEMHMCSCGEIETREIPMLPASNGANPVVTVVIVVVALGAVAAAAFVFMKKSI